MNKVILMGRLTKNPEIKYAGKDNDMAVARYTLAVNRSINVTESRKQILSPVSHLERVRNLYRNRLHHEIYMPDARKVAPDKWKTVIRHPIKKA